MGDDAHPHVVFEYSPTREKKWPEGFLRGWRGYLQADAFAGYDAMYAREGIISSKSWETWESWPTLHGGRHPQRLPSKVRP